MTHGVNLASSTSSSDINHKEGGPTNTNTMTNAAIIFCCLYSLLK